MRRPFAVVLASVLALAVAFSGCTGGGTGGSPDRAEAPDEGGRATPGDDLLDPVGCGADPTFATGANRLPDYDLLPAPAVPRVIREAERHARVDLSEFVPTPCNQGELFACTAWAGGYGLMTYLAAENIEGWFNLDRTDRHFSPTFILNQVNGFQMDRSPQNSCLLAGTLATDMFILLRDVGCTTWLDVPYTADDCQTQPNDAALARAGDYRIGYFRSVERDVETIQSYLDQRIPIVVTLHLGPAFFELKPGDVYGRNEADRPDGFSHSVLVVGYDDDVGGIKIMNSWGTRWGDGGFGFISYDVWEEISAEAYVVGRELVTPIASVTQAAAAKLGPTGQAIEVRNCAHNPLADSDGDGYPDTLELEFASFGLDPFVPDDNPDYEPIVDSDGDGWPDATESVFGTDHASADDFPFDCDYTYPEGFFDEFPSPDAAGARFRITGVDSPPEVTADGERGTLAVFWDGDPLFPVTLVYRPVEGGCPVGADCQTVTTEFTDQANPLVAPNAVFCKGFRESAEFGFEVVLVDVTGLETEPVGAGFTCLAP